MYGKICFYMVPKVTPPTHGGEGPLFAKRCRQHPTFNGANERSHPKLFESTIRFEFFVVVQKLPGQPLTLTSYS